LSIVLATSLAFLFGYLAGSIPSGVLITRLAGAADPRGIGSGNIGATNVLRTGRKDLAALTLIADALKGTIAVLVAIHFDAGQGLLALGPAAAAGAFLGHLFSLFLGFRGGKGVATFLGCLIGLAWPAALAFAVIWLAAVAATRRSSVGALAASAATPVALLLIGQRTAALLFLGLAILLWIKHHANIARLIAGTESKVGQKS
jgi:glycerol-3-phosphate acyltransferase PlsY